MTTVFLAIMSLALIYLCIFVTKKSDIRTEYMKLQLSVGELKEIFQSLQEEIKADAISRLDTEVHQTQFQILATISAKITKIEDSLLTDQKPLDAQVTKDDSTAYSLELIQQIKEFRKQGLSYRKISARFSLAGKKISPSLVRRLHLQDIEKECE